MTKEGWEKVRSICKIYICDQVVYQEIGGFFVGFLSDLESVMKTKKYHKINW